MMAAPGPPEPRLFARHDIVESSKIVMHRSCLILLASLCLGSALVTAADPASSKILLHGPWALQSACAVRATGAEISSSGFATQGWHQTEVPSTVVAALVADKTYPD